MHTIQKCARSLKSFSSGHAFSLMTALCICVIASTAVWSKHTPHTTVLSTSPAINLPASLPMQQSLDEAQLPQTSLLPEQHWQSPLGTVQIIEEFSDSTMLYSTMSGLWTVHAGIDLSAEKGAPVYAMASGHVLDVVEKDIYGTWVSIQHNDGYVSKYCSLDISGAYQAGDQVHAGSIIGFVGCSYADEASQGPHLHLEVYRNGTPIDPMTLLE